MYGVAPTTTNTENPCEANTIPPLADGTTQHSAIFLSRPYTNPFPVRFMFTVRSHKNTSLCHEQRIHTRTFPPQEDCGRPKQKKKEVSPPGDTSLCLRRGCDVRKQSRQHHTTTTGKRNAGIGFIPITVPTSRHEYHLRSSGQSVGTTGYCQSGARDPPAEHKHKH